MQAKTIVLAAFLILAITSCIPSIHPIYDADTQVFDPALLGTWLSVDNNQTWVFGPGLRQNNTYQLTQTDGEGNSGEFTVHLTKIGGARFIDLFPEEGRNEGNSFFWYHYYRIHTFMRVELEENDLRLYFVDYAWISNQLKSNPESLAHTFSDQTPETHPEYVSDFEFPILTASTEEVRAYLESMIDIQEAWRVPIELKREIVEKKKNWNVRIEGDTLFIDEESLLAKRATENDFPVPVFHRFDGVYPADWPAGFFLPEGYFLLAEKLELSEASNDPEAHAAGIRAIGLNGLSPLSIDETINWFRRQGIALDLELTNDEYRSTVGETAMAIELVGPGYHDVSFRDAPDLSLLISTRIFLHEDLGGYTFVTGKVVMNVNK